MKRQSNSYLFYVGGLVLVQYERTLREQKDLTVASVRNYLSDVRHFIAWYEPQEAECAVDAKEASSAFHPQAITTPTLTYYRTYLQRDQRQESASVNRSLISLKRYFSWAIQRHLIIYDPSMLPLERCLRSTFQPSLTRQFFSLSSKAWTALSERVQGYIIKKYGIVAKLTDVSLHDLHSRFGYRMAEVVPLYRLAQIMGHDLLDMTKLDIQGAKQDLQQAVETIAWI